MAMDKVLDYLEKNKQRFVDDMSAMVRIKSVSNDVALRNDTRHCAEVVRDHLIKIGVKKAELIETPLHPIVYGEMINDPKKPTFLVYGHYDVQPAEMSDGWKTPPFEPVVKDGFIYGRGTADDKGKMLMAINAIEAFTKTGTPLAVNFKFFIEGEEEAGSEHTADYVKKCKDILKCDGVIVFDTPWILPGLPSITYSLRGLCYWIVDLKGPNRDLHSGIYGGKVRNPLNVAAYLVAKLHDEKGRVTIPGFYDDVVPLTDAEKKEFAALPFNDDDIKKDVEMTALWGEEGYTALERNWGRPALDCNGIKGGFIADGAKTVIPSEAQFKVSSRLVANQDPKKIDAGFKAYMQKLCPPEIEMKISTVQAVSPNMVPTDNKFLKAMAEAIEAGFGKKPALIRNGASIPITATFLDVLGAPSLMFDSNVPDENIHGPNEKLLLDAFYKGMKAAAYFYELAGK